MINRIFFVVDNLSLLGNLLPDEENVFFSVRVDPLDEIKLKEIYKFTIDNPRPPIALTLSLTGILPHETIRLLTSFFFLDSSLQIDDKPVINLMGDNPEVLSGVEISLKDYCKIQGLDEVIVNTIPGIRNQDLNYSTARSPQEAIRLYRDFLSLRHFGTGTLFALLAANDNLQDLLKSLGSEDLVLDKEFPGLSDLIIKYRLLEKEATYLKRKLILNEKELANQKQYQDILRSQHSTRQLQDYYNNEYEILPKWYKQMGHVLKVIMGKRTLKSLFRDDVKKYRD
jgi:hypothetical protein